jgi:chromosome segregation ATPase
MRRVFGELRVDSQVQTIREALECWSDTAIGSEEEREQYDQALAALATLAERLAEAERERDGLTGRNQFLSTEVALREARVEALEAALAAYRSALRSGEPETDQLRAFGDAALSTEDSP